MSDKLAAEIISRNSAGKSKRSNFDTLWQQCADYYRPRKGQILSKTTQGQDQTNQIYDTTGGEAATVFSAGMLSSLTPPGEKWIRLQPKNKKAPEVVKNWLTDCSDKMLEMMLASNFYLAIHEDFDDAGVFNTSCLLTDEDPESICNFTCIPCGTYWVQENNRGIVDTVFREWKWTARQAAQQWGVDALGDKMKKALASDSPNDRDIEYTFIHAVYPRMKGEYNEDGGKVEGTRRKIASCYVCVEDCAVVQEDGYYEMPLSVARLARSNNEVYGRGPGLDALPTVRLLNRMEFDLLMATEKMVNPPWIMSEDSAYKPDNRPGGITYFDASINSEINKPQMVDYSKMRIDMGEQKTEQKRTVIRRIFYNDTFQMLNNPEVLSKDRTAFQISQMLQEKLQLFSPMFARYTQEKLNLTLERVFNIMLRNGEFLPLPEGVDADYDIVYTSKIALAVQQYQITTLMNVIQLATTMVQFDQSVPMVIKWRDEFRNACRNLGLSAAAARTDEEIDEMMAEMQKKQDMAQAAGLTDSLTKSVKNMGPDAQKAAVEAIS